MIIDFSSLGSGQDKDVDLCGACNYTVTIRSKIALPGVAWLTGDQIRQQYNGRDVKIIIDGIAPCKACTHKKAQHDILNAALASGVDINDKTDRYRRDVLQQRHLYVFGDEYENSYHFRQPLLQLAPFF